MSDRTQTEILGNALWDVRQMIQEALDAPELSGADLRNLLAMTRDVVIDPARAEANQVWTAEFEAAQAKRAKRNARRRKAA